MTDKPKDSSSSFLQPNQRGYRVLLTGYTVSPEIDAGSHKGDLAQFGYTHLGFQHSDGGGSRIVSSRSISTF